MGSVADLFNHLDRVLWLVTARDGGRRGGLVATFVSPASIVPEMPRVLVGMARHHHTWGLVEASGAFALHLIGEEQIDWVWRFGLRSGRDGDKLDGLAIRDGATTNVPILTDALGWLECRIESRMETGDRTVYLAEVLDGALTSPRPPLSSRRLGTLAPEERVRELRGQMERDIAIDAEAIRAWRGRIKPE